MKPLALSAYLAFSARATGWGERQLAKRLARGKEHPDRLGERRGQASVPRPHGPLIWFHAASVGESLSLLEVIKRLGDHDPALNFLLTTGTVTSGEILASRLPPRTIHQFVPLDVRPWVRRFLDHWRPDLSIWVESELWPALLTETRARGTPMLLLNARISARSARRWTRLKRTARHLLNLFESAQIQDDISASLLQSLGFPKQRMAVTGTLKEGTPAPPCDEAELTRLTKLLEGRTLWCAASTHPGEETQVAQAHQSASAAIARLLLILVPRHPDRAEAIQAELEAAGLSVARRSQGQLPDLNCDVYLADTIGEMGLWFRLAPLSFVAGSLTPIGGHNPFEPAALGSAILHGPHIRNFASIYARLDAAGAARLVEDGSELAQAVIELHQPARSAAMAHAAWEICSSGAEVTDKALALILDHLPAAAGPGI